MKREPWHFDGKDEFGPLGSHRLAILVFANYNSQSYINRGGIDWQPMGRIWLPVLLPLGLDVPFTPFENESVLREVQHVTDARFHLRGDALKARLAEFSAALVIQQHQQYLPQWMDDQMGRNPFNIADAGSAACLASFAASKEKAKTTPTKKR